MRRAGKDSCIFNWLLLKGLSDTARSALRSPLEDLCGVAHAVKNNGFQSKRGGTVERAFISLNLWFNWPDLVVDMWVIVRFVLCTTSFEDPSKRMIYFVLLQLCALVVCWWPRKHVQNSRGPFVNAACLLSTRCFETSDVTGATLNMF